MNGEHSFEPIPDTADELIELIGMTEHEARFLAVEMLNSCSETSEYEDAKGFLELLAGSVARKLGYEYDGPAHERGADYDSVDVDAIRELIDLGIRDGIACALMNLPMRRKLA